MTLNLDQIRAQTPGATGHIHLDNAGAALMPQSVLDAQIEHLRLEAEIGGYEAAGQRTAEMEAAYAMFARLIGAASDEIALTGSATDAWDRAFFSLPLKAGDRILTGFNEYCSNFVAMLDARRKIGFEIVVIGTNAEGDLDLAHLEAEAEAGAALIVMAHVPSSSGQINPVADVGKIARAYDIPYLLDTCQSLGQMEVNVCDIGCHMACFTGRKFLRGPRGIGALYIDAGFMDRLEPVFMTNQSAEWKTPDSFEARTDARLFEAWERNVAAQLGFGAACDYLLALDRAAAFERTQVLAARLRAGLGDIPGVTLTDPGRELAAIVTCTVEGKTPWDIRAAMAARGITTQVAGAQHTRIDMDARGITEAMRLSPHYYLLDQDIDTTLNAFEDAMKVA